MNQPPSPPWQSLLAQQFARHEHLPYSRFVQAATVRSDGRPANRTLTFRFFLGDDRLLFTTDTRTEKITQLAANPWAELCWYFTESRVQFRLLGRMAWYAADASGGELAEARECSWKERSAESRQSFTWPPAGQPLANAAVFAHNVPDTPPDCFGLLVLAPERVDILDLMQQPHARTIHTLGHGHWSSAAVNP